tara:strand:- start:307 stop:525 length:219 start_codon:yes stop_codon:yes gene_type:complete
MRTVTLDDSEFNLLTNLLVDHLEEISEDEFFHSASSDECLSNMEVTKNTIRSMHCAKEDDIVYTEQDAGCTC